jgi:hypothetical protein
MDKIRKMMKAINFIEYISKNMKKDDMFLLHRINNIKRERLTLLLDFVYSLNELVVKTYLGDDITKGKDKEKHFDWCWKQVIDAFKKEGIYFIDKDQLKEYFLTFYQESFYEDDKDEERVNKISLFWEELLDFNKTKTMSEYETLVELYKIFNKSFDVR